MSTMVIRALAFFIHLLSWRAAQRLGAFLGAVWFYLVPVRRRTVMKNLETVFGPRPKQNKEVALSAYKHFGVSAMEFLKMRRMTDDELASKVRVHGLENYEAANAAATGVVVVTAHVGNFDLLACSQSAIGIPLAIVSRDLHRGGVSRFWMETRGGKKLKIFPDEGAAKPILKWLKKGGALGLTVDQRTPERRGGIRIPFMGTDAWTTTAPGKLAAATGSPLLPVHSIRAADGNHDIYIEPAISASNMEKEEQVRMWTLQINTIVGTWVEEAPGQWLWLHRRFVDSN